jgi:cbb3-type cytochrome oxidase subunit 3
VKLSDVMSAMGLSLYAEVALVIFFLVFVGIVAELAFRRRSPVWEHARRLPLDDGESEPFDSESRGASDG